MRIILHTCLSIFLLSSCFLASDSSNQRHYNFADESCTNHQHDVTRKERLKNDLGISEEEAQGLIEDERRAKITDHVIEQLKSDLNMNESEVRELIERRRHLTNQELIDSKDSHMIYKRIKMLPSYLPDPNKIISGVEENTNEEVRTKEERRDHLLNKAEQLLTQYKASHGSDIYIRHAERILEDTKVNAYGSVFDRIAQRFK